VIKVIQLAKTEKTLVDLELNTNEWCLGIAFNIKEVADCWDIKFLCLTVIIRKRTQLWEYLWTGKSETHYTQEIQDHVSALMEAMKKEEEGEIRAAVEKEKERKYEEKGWK